MLKIYPKQDLKTYNAFSGEVSYLPLLKRLMKPFGKYYRMKNALRAAIFEYIYCFYDGTRIQNGLGYMLPIFQIDAVERQVRRIYRNGGIDGDSYKK